MATLIVFAGSTKDEPLSITVDQRVVDISRDANGLSAQTRDGKPLAINLSNVLYLEQIPEGEEPSIVFL